MRDVAKTPFEARAGSTGDLFKKREEIPLLALTWRLEIKLWVCLSCQIGVSVC